MKNKYFMFLLFLPVLFLSRNLGAILGMMFLGVIFSFFYFSKISLPEDIKRERMIYMYSTSNEGAVNSRFSRDASVFVRGDGASFVFSSNGYVVGFVKSNLVKGDEVYVYWFNRCHGLVKYISRDCVEVLSINGEDLEYVKNLYKESRAETLFFLISFGMVLFLIVFVGCIINTRGNYDIR